MSITEEAHRKIVRGLSDRNCELAMSVSEKNTEIERLRAVLTNERVAVDREHGEKDKLRKEVAYLREVIINKDAKITNLHKTIEDLENKLRVSAATNWQELISKRDARLVEIETLSAKLARSEAQVAYLRGVNLKLENDAEEDGLSTRLRAEINDRNKDIEYLRKTVSNLTTDFIARGDIIRDKDAEITRLKFDRRQEIISLKETINKQVLEIATLRAALRLVVPGALYPQGTPSTDPKDETRATSEIDRLRALIVDKNKEIKKLRTEIDISPFRKGMNEKLQRENEKLREKLARLDAEIARIRAAVHEAVDFDGTANELEAEDASQSEKKDVFDALKQVGKMFDYEDVLASAPSTDPKDETKAEPVPGPTASLSDDASPEPEKKDPCDCAACRGYVFFLGYDPSFK